MSSGTFRATITRYSAPPACLLLVGLIDDGWALRGRQKLLLQCLILSALVGGGTLIKQINIFGVDVELGVLAFPITVAWLLLAVNALNLIDGADGMATTAGCIISTGLGIIGLCSGSFLTAVIAFSLAAALLTFLVFNRPPASIYLGDAGSMTIGLFIGVLAVWSSVKESTILASAPVAILAIPLFDSTAAILRRWLTGRSIYTTDRAHLHHLLQEKLGPVRMLLVVAGLCITTTSLAVLSVVFNQPWLAGLGVVMVTAMLILTRSFGHAEAKLLIGRTVHFVTILRNHSGHERIREPSQPCRFAGGGKVGHDLGAAGGIREGASPGPSQNRSEPGVVARGLPCDLAKCPASGKAIAASDQRPALCTSTIGRIPRTDRTLGGGRLDGRS